MTPPRLGGSGSAEIAVEQVHRHRRIARALRDQVEQLGTNLSEAHRRDALAAAGRMDAEADLWQAALREYAP